MTAHPRSLDGTPLPPAPTKNRWRRFVERRLPIVVLYLMVVALIAVVIAPYVLVTVPSGHVGLVWKRFRGGTLLDPSRLKDEGLRAIWPWDKMFLYDLRLQSSTDTYNAITKDGVSLTAAINVRYRLKHDAIPQLHQAIGPHYLPLLVRPEIGSRMREVIAEYTAEEVYSTKRQEVQNRIRGHAEAMLGEKMMERTAEQSEYGDHYRVALDRLLVLYDTLVLGIELPPTVVGAINRKVEQYYLVEEYTFRVERERKESERKKIEAEGIREFQQTVSQGISDSYVRWRGIEATLQLAQSPNSKVVIIGAGKDGLPIILGNADAPSQPQGKATSPEEGAPQQRTKAAGATPDATLPHNVVPPGEPKSPHAPTSEAPHSASPLPLSWSDIEGFLSRLSGTARPTGPEPPRQRPEKPPAAPAQ